MLKDKMNNMLFDDELESVNGGSGIEIIQQRKSINLELLELAKKHKAGEITHEEYLKRVNELRELREKLNSYLPTISFGE